MVRSPKSESPSRLALLVLALGSPLLLVAFLTGEGWGLPVAALLVGALPAALFALEAAPRLRRSRRRIVLQLLLAVWSGGVLTVYAATVYAPTDVWWGGFPLPTALLIYGLGLGLWIATGVYYAAAFDRLGVDSRDLERLGRLAAEGSDEPEEGR